MSYDVILAAYNGEKYIQEQIESILRQTIKPNKIIVRDDCSTDKTLDILLEYSKNTDIPFLVIADGTNLGYIKNFEAMIEYTTSDFVFFSDQDDLWINNKAEVLLGALQRNATTNVVFSDAYLVNDEKKNIGSLWNSIGFSQSEEIISLQRQLTNNIVTGATMAVRRNFLISTLPFPANVPHDYWIATNACATDGLFPVKDKLICYRQHAGNQIGAGNSSPGQKIKSLFSSYRRAKRMTHYREIYTISLGLIENGVLQRKASIYIDMMEYLSCVNAIYQGKIYQENDRKNILAALTEKIYWRYSSRKNILTDIIDGALLRLFNSNSN